MKKLTLCLAFGLISTFVFQLNAQKINSNLTKQFEQKLEQNELKPSDVQYRITSEHLSKTSNVHHIYFKQSINGIDVYGTESSIHISENGKTLTSSILFVKNSVEKSAGVSSPSITAAQAVSAAANQLNYSVSESFSIIENAKGTNKKTLLSDGGISKSPIPAKLVYHISDDNQLVLAWDISIQEKSQQDWWSIRVDATTGQILDKNNWMLSCSFEHDHSSHEVLNYNKNLFDIPNYNSKVTTEEGGCTTCYEVFEMPLESPYFGARSIATGIEDPTASPFGWHDTNGAAGAEFTVTRGNNVNAYEDGNNSGYQPDGGANLDFTGFPFSQVYSNTNQYEDAAITNLFYWNNIIHDVMYQYGFDEIGGNFQENNYGNGGAGNDSVNAEAQDGSGTCNANFGTPGDGGSPTMQMFVCSDKDGDFDNLVIVHEYGHGISNRLTGGPNDTGCLWNAEQMGEGWSDFFGVLMTIEPGDTGTDARAVGTYLFGQGAGGAGIRTYPYSTDMAVNPQTYNNIITTGGQPHAVGEIWGGMLWELAWGLIDAHGFDADIYNFSGTNADAGNVAALALVIEGLKLQPCSPGFVDGRDAILAADQAIYGGANECIIWDAFAKRGLGISAVQGSSNSVTDNTEAFDTPSGTAAFTAPADVCANEVEMTGLSGGTPSGGVYSGNGVTDDGNGSTYSFNPQVAGVGVHTISYEIQAGTCSTASTATDTIEVIAIPPGPTTTGASGFCIGDSVTVTATLADPNNVIRWYDAQVGGNFLFEGTNYTFVPTGSTNVYAQEVPPGPLSKLVISEITLETPDRFEIQNVGQAFDYTGYSVAVSKDPYPDVNAINSIVQTLGVMGADAVVDYNDDSGSGYWGNNIWWDNNGTGWIIIIDNNGNVVDSVFWNFTAAEISGLNVSINGFTVTAADLDWTGTGAALTVDCSGSFRRNGDTDTASDWSGVCETADYGVPNADINIGNSGCLGDRTVAVITADAIAPTITCTSDIQVSADANNCYASGVSLTDPAVSDNCGVQSLTNDAPINFPIGDTNVLWTVTDTNGNTATCTQVVTVVDDIDPTISCSGTITISTDTNNCFASAVNLVTPTTSDNCSVQSVTNDAPTNLPIGDTTVVWTVTDSSGNTATCTQIVTVIDDILPTVTCSSNVVVFVDTNQCAASGVVLLDPAASDNCGIQSITNNAPSNYPLGVTNVIWTITDNSGNTTTCTQVVTVLDNIDPEIVCPSDISETVNEGELFTIPDYTTSATATDNCTTSPTITQMPVAGTDIGVGVTVITLTATDDSGNDVTCTFNVTITEILGTVDNNLAEQIVLFPNPANNQVTLINNSAEQLVSATLFDVNGRRVQQLDLENASVETTISIANYATGIYFIQIQAENSSLIKRIVKE